MILRLETPLRPAMGGANERSRSLTSIDSLLGSPRRSVRSRARSQNSDGYRVAVEGVIVEEVIPLVNDSRKWNVEEECGR